MTNKEIVEALLEVNESICPEVRCTSCEYCSCISDRGYEEYCKITGEDAGEIEENIISSHFNCEDLKDALNGCSITLEAIVALAAEERKATIEKISRLLEESEYYYDDDYDEEGPYGGAFRDEYDFARHVGIDLRY